MLRSPPHILVTTPESLYLLLTAEREPRDAARRAHGDRRRDPRRRARQARLAPRALARAARRRCASARPAADRPVGDAAADRDDRAPAGRRRQRASTCRRPPALRDRRRRATARALDLAIEVPGSELGAVASAEQMGRDLRPDRRAWSPSTAPRSCSSNTRRLAERVAHLLGERLGDDQVAAHHGSLSRERRQRVEERLRAGELRALVATASLELGIDIGPVELVCQIGSPRSHRHVPAARRPLGPRARRDAEGARCSRPRATSWSSAPRCVRGRARGPARRACTRRWRRSTSSPSRSWPSVPRAETWNEDELFALVRRAAPYAELPRERLRRGARAACRRASPPDAAGAPRTCTATA